jgi:DsbC/DsbD-like thiol-disulfide interchange protein
MTAAAESPMEIALVSSVKTIQPGKPFYVALSLQHGRGHHSYWKVPGIVGMPTGMKWTALPSGFEAGEIEWPAPERVFMFQIKAQGYRRDVLLPVLITPSRSIRPGEVVTLRGTAAWMSCAKQCNPGFEDLELTLPVTASDVPEYDPKWQPLVQRELDSAARSSPAWTLSVEPEGDVGYVATLSPAQGAQPISERAARKLVWFTEDGQVDTDKAQRIEWNEGRVSFHLSRPEYLPGGFKQSLTGILIREDGWLQDGSLPVLRVSAKW